MAYAVKYYYEFKDVQNVLFRVNLLQRDYVGSATELTAGAVPFVEDVETEGRYDEIAAKVFDLQVITQTGFSLLDIYTSDSREFKVEVRSDPAGTNTLWFAGWIEGIKGGESLKGGRQTLELTASCGLGQLRNEPYAEADGTPYTGIVIKRDIIQTILSKLDLGLKFAIAQNWVNDGDGSYSSTAVKVDNKTYYNESGEPLTCLEVLKDILGQLNCEIFQEMGVWRIRNIDLLREASYDYYVYSAAGTYDSVETFTNTPKQLGSTYKMTEGSKYSALPPIKRFEASLRLGRYRNQLPNGDFNEDPKVSIPQWTNTLFSVEVGGDGTVQNRSYVRINQPMRSPQDIKQSNFLAWQQFILDIQENLTSTNIAISNFDLDVWEFKGWINASGSGVAVALRFEVITNEGPYFLKSDGTFSEPNDRYRADTFHEYYPDFVKQEGATRVGLPDWTEVKKDVDLSYFKRLIEIRNRGPRDNDTPFALQNLRVIVYRPSVLNPNTLSGQYVKIANFQLNKRKAREIEAQVFEEINDVKTPLDKQSFEFWTGDYFDTTELATTYFGDGETPTGENLWTNPQTSQEGTILQIMLKERASQYARSYIRIEGGVEGRKQSASFLYSHIAEVTGFASMIFKQVRRRYNLQKRSLESELQEMI